jgi:hypothetical protein
LTRFIATSVRKITGLAFSSGVVHMSPSEHSACFFRRRKMTPQSIHHDQIRWLKAMVREVSRSAGEPTRLHCMEAACFSVAEKVNKPRAPASATPLPCCKSQCQGLVPGNTPSLPYGFRGSHLGFFVTIGLVAANHKRFSDFVKTLKSSSRRRGLQTPLLLSS